MGTSPETPSSTGGLDSNMPPGTVGPLSQAEWQKYCDLIGERESNNNYRALDQLGLAGRWLFGAAALTDHGYIRAGVSNKDTASASSWTGKDGIKSREDWLASKAAQDAVMLDFTRNHFTALRKNEAIKDTSSHAHIAGILAAAHLVGVGGAIKLAKGQTSTDAGGTTSLAYYRLLSKAFGGPETVTV